MKEKRDNMDQNNKSESIVISKKSVLLLILIVIISTSVITYFFVSGTQEKILVKEGFPVSKQNGEISLLLLRTPVDVSDATVTLNLLPSN